MYLFFLLKKSQGNDDNNVVSPRTSQRVSKALSINGEVVNVINLEDINIHDFAKFESEQGLKPEFKASIRKRGSGIELSRKMSFVEAAKHVQTVRSVLRRWPKRPRSRHHSSSSEDMIEESDNETDTSVNVNNNKPINEDCLSSHTIESEISPSEESQNNSPIKTNQGSGNTNAKHESVEHVDSNTFSTTEHDSNIRLRTERSSLVQKERKRLCPCVVL